MKKISSSTGGRYWAWTRFTWRVWRSRRLPRCTRATCAGRTAMRWTTRSCCTILHYNRWWNPVSHRIGIYVVYQLHPEVDRSNNCAPGTFWYFFRLLMWHERWRMIPESRCHVPRSGLLQRRWADCNTVNRLEISIGRKREEHSEGDRSIPWTPYGVLTPFESGISVNPCCIVIIYQ